MASFFNTHFNMYSNLHLHFKGGLFPLSILTKILYTFLYSPCILHIVLVLLDLITLITIGKEYKLWCSSISNVSIILLFSLSCITFHNIMVFHSKVMLAPTQYTMWRTAPFRPSMTYSIHAQLSSTPGNYLMLYSPCLWRNFVK